MKKIILACAVALFFASLPIACKKNDTTTTTASCSDGIQNQGETGVDCGGPCKACAKPLCEGKGSSSYMPLKDKNAWSYDPVAGNGSYTLTINGTKVYNSKTYFSIDWYYGSVSYSTLYYRTESNGDIYYYDDNSSTEYMYLPASPTVGQQWAHGTGTFKVNSVNASKATSACAYTGLLEIYVYDSSNTQTDTYYFKKGVGEVYRMGVGSFSFPYQLTAVTLN